jgi:hypothetical protein
MNFIQYFNNLRSQVDGLKDIAHKLWENNGDFDNLFVYTRKNKKNQ